LLLFFKAGSLEQAQIGQGKAAARLDVIMCHAIRYRAKYLGINRPLSGINRHCYLGQPAHMSVTIALNPCLWRGQRFLQVLSWLGYYKLNKNSCNRLPKAV
jgi:hypothetical protein